MKLFDVYWLVKGGYMCYASRMRPVYLRPLDIKLRVIRAPRAYIINSNFNEDPVSASALVAPCKRPKEQLQAPDIRPGLVIDCQPALLISMTQI